jgi:uncharacterized membrane protein
MSSSIDVNDPAGGTARPVAAGVPGPVVRQARAVALAGLLGLIALGLAWELWLAPTGSGTLAIKVLPLALCLAGLWRHRMVTFRWLALLLWLYVLEALVRATTEGGLSQALAVLQLLLCLLLFAASAVYIRWRLRTSHRAAEETP